MERLSTLLSFLFLCAFCHSANAQTTGAQPANGDTETVTEVQKQNMRDRDRFPRITFSEKSLNPKEKKQVLVISGSTHRDGNTDLLCQAFARGAREAGHEVEYVFLHDKRIGFFTDEQFNEDCDSMATPSDDAREIIEKMKDADVVCMASPVYFWTIDAMVKALIDRTFYCFREMPRGKEFFFMTVCGNGDIHVTDGAINTFRGFISCLPQAVERGTVRATGMRRSGDIKGTAFEQQAYELGKTL